MVDEGAASERLLRLRDESDLVGVRRHVRELGALQGLTPLAIQALATAVTEIVRNVIVHAESGQVRLYAARARGAGSGRAAVVVEVADLGPGIISIDAAMADGYSTGAGLGLGLPGARRMVDLFEVRTTVGQGTTVTLEKWAEPDPSHL
jgi:serine/threonine-protein kinase RsbT